MAVPSRMYVGVVVFGLITTLAVMAYALLLAGGYQPPPDSPFEILFPEQEEGVQAGEILFLSLAGAFTAAFTVFAWRRLLKGARQDAARRRRMKELQHDLRQYRRQNRPPPGQT